MNAFPPGFTPEKTLVMRVSLSGAQYRTWSRKRGCTQELLCRIETVPGVQAVGLDCGTLNTSVHVEGAPATSPLREEPFAAIRFVSPGYLRAIGVPLLPRAVARQQ
ncbi:MAG: hypothetical protein DMG57_26795 [Acidobacteria bacterium]|nr:MAG: hypothetical protein DMG57_26795 [Acidobacteriota bacterium]